MSVDSNKKEKSLYYVDPEALKQEIIRFQKTGIMSNELGNMFLAIAKRYVSRPNFNGYSYRDEFISSAVYRMVRYAENIDPSKNCFAYLTQITHFSALATLKKEKKFSELKAALTDDALDDIAHDEGIVIKKRPDDELD